MIVAFFWDVESGRTRLDLRGHSDAHELFTVPVPRDGGVADLWHEARQPGRRFVAMVCESVDRLARVTYFGTKIEYELEQSGVALLAADEGIAADALPSATGARSAPSAHPRPSTTCRARTAFRPRPGSRLGRRQHDRGGTNGAPTAAEPRRGFSLLVCAPGRSHGASTQVFRTAETVEGRDRGYVHIANKVGARGHRARTTAV